MKTLIQVLKDVMEENFEEFITKVKPTYRIITVPFFIVSSILVVILAFVHFPVHSMKFIKKDGDNS
ncbi:MAG: hypothetical protein ACM3O3_09735 [Syntrophothermus sp.]